MENSRIINELTPKKKKVLRTNKRKTKWLQEIDAKKQNSDWKRQHTDKYTVHLRQCSPYIFLYQQRLNKKEAESWR